MKTPSLELLSVVFGVNVTQVVTDINDIKMSLNLSITENEIAIVHSERWHYINVYEISNKCKEWAHGLSLEFEVTSILGYFKDNYKWCVYIEPRNTIIVEDTYTKSFLDNSEPDAIIQACQWILENVKD